MQETRVLVETRGTTGEETISYWFELPIDVAEFEEKLGIGVRKSRLPHYTKRQYPFADEVHEHTSVYQLNELDFMYRQLSSDMQEEYVSLLTVFENLEALLYLQKRDYGLSRLQKHDRCCKAKADERPDVQTSVRGLSRILF